MTSRRSFAGSALIIAACFLLRGSLEAHPVTHVLVQKPGLVFAGWLMGHCLAERWATLRSISWNQGGATGMIIASFVSAFWMLPRYIDWSIDEAAGEAAKFISIPFLIGLPLALSWPRLPLLAHCLIKTNVISMLLCLAWVYNSAPDRLCNNYLLGQQQQLGNALLWLASTLSLGWSAALFGFPFDSPGKRLKREFSEKTVA